MARSQQRKGRAGELELVKVLNDAGVSVQPGDPVSYGKTPDIIGFPGIHCEVKRVEKLNISLAMEQAERDALKFHDGLPAVFHRKNRSPWLVTMKLTDWMKLYTHIFNLQGEYGQKSGHTEDAGKRRTGADQGAYHEY